MSDFEKRRVSYIGLRADAPQERTVQLVSSVMMVRRLPPEQEGGPHVYEGPVIAGWENVKHSYPGLFDDLTLMGAIVALPPNVGMQYAGHIDWVRPLDRPKENENIIDAEYEVVKH